MVINGGYPGGDACLAATVAWALIAPHARAWHNFHNLALSYPSGSLRRLKERWVDAMVARAAAGFVSVSEACSASLVLARPVFADKPASVIYNGIASFEAARNGDLREELGLPAQSRIVLMLGVYEPRKGHAFAIGMMAKVVEVFPDAWLLACGDGSEEEMRAVEVVRDQSPARCHILLHRHRHDLPNLLAQVDVLIMPSQAQESFGYTVVEAMACSLPVVVSDIGGLPEVASDGLSGYVVRYDDANAFAERIVAILSDGVLARRLGKAGRQRYEENFQAVGMGAKYHRLFAQGTSLEATSAPPLPDRSFEQ
jgi:glycosyltransferase involved in cell wall biosynthesis